MIARERALIEASQKEDAMHELEQLMADVLTLIRSYQEENHEQIAWWHELKAKHEAFVRGEHYENDQPKSAD